MAQPRVLILDNNDSFTFNLVQAFGDLGVRPTVVGVGVGRELDPDDFELVVISPGPGAPGLATEARALVEKSAGRRPVLGVCLGHQVIVEAYGGKVGPAPSPRHGAVSQVEHDGKELFDGLPNPMDAVRYHSLAVTDVGPILEPSAWSEDGVIQAVRHPDLEIDGVQFHPESLLTKNGRDLLGNFLKRA